MAIEPELDTVGLLMWPLAAMVGGLIVMLLATNFFRILVLVTTSTWAASKGEVVRAIVPIAKTIRTVLEGAMGPLGSIKFSLQDVLLCAILIVLTGVWRNSSRQVAVLQSNKPSKEKTSSGEEKDASRVKKA